MKPARAERFEVEALVIGSGAGGAVTALELASQGLDVVILEEGPNVAVARYGEAPPQGLGLLYRRQGMTPILGSSAIGFVQGCCVGGSTEINSGFWHRTPPEVLHRWGREFALDHCSPEQLAQDFEWAERLLNVGPYPGPLPPSSAVFARGAAARGWDAREIARAAPGCRSTNTCAQGCPTGAKQGMSRSLLPLARARGARLIPGCRVQYLLRRGSRITGVAARLTMPHARWQMVEIESQHVFVCCGPTETPALLRRSGIRHRVGATLQIHPMLKVAARFDERIDAHESVLPLLQIRDLAPSISLGGSYFTPGYLAMLLGENWPHLGAEMSHYRNMALYYVGSSGAGRGHVRPALIDADDTVVRYELGRQDLTNLSTGLAHLSSLLLAAGATAVHPAVSGLPAIRSEREANRWLGERLPAKALSLTSVHAFSSCPMGEVRERCATDSFGKVWGYDNLYVNDASLLPDSPGVNPQGSVMAFARRNSRHFAQARA